MELSLNTLSPTANHILRLLKPLTIVTGVALTLCLILYFGVLLPAEDRLIQVSSTFDQLRQQQIQRQAARKTQEQLAKLWAQLPAQKDFSAIGMTITKLAKGNDVRIPGMQYRLEPSKDGMAAKGSISFEAFGAYEAIRKFIYKIETTGSHLVIEKLTAQRSKKSDQVFFKIQVGTFFKPESSLAPKGPNTT